MARRLPVLLGCLALLLAVAPAAYAAPRVATAASAGRTFAAAARSVDAGGRLTVTGMRLQGQAMPATLELQRLEVWDPTAQVVMHPGGTAPPTTQGPPDVRFFTGSLAGAPGSAVVLSVDAAGGVNGLVAHGRERWTLGRPALSPQAAAAGAAPAGLSSRKAVQSAAASNRQPFRCGASGLEAPQPPQQAQQAQQGKRQGGAARKLLQTSPLIASLALETDGELLKRFSGSTTALKNYVGQLVAYANTIFKKEIGVELRIVWLGMYGSPATDPWPTLPPVPGAEPPYYLDAGPGLEFLRSYWNNPANKRTGIKRTLVHMLSGQNTTGGIAYTGVLCHNWELGGTPDAQFVSDYGFTGLITSLGQMDWSNNPAEYATQPVWDMLGFFHEMGHQFGSWHTHDYCKVTPSDPTTIDDCAPTAYGCSQLKVDVLPSCTATPGYAGGAGTIMSYCQNVRSNFSDVAMTFGLNHPCGRRPGRVVTSIKQHVQQRAAKFPACFTTTVPAPPPAPVPAPNGKWSTPIIVNSTLPFTSGVIQTYWATGAPEYKCNDYADGRSVYVLRWFASRTYDNAQVTVSSCGRLQNTGVPAISVRSTPTSTNSGPYGCIGATAYGCSYPDKAFKYTFKSVADTFYYFIVFKAVDGAPAPKLSLNVSAALGNANGRWVSPLAVPVNPYGGNTRTSWLSGEYKSFLPVGVPSDLCNDGSSGRPYIAFRWASGVGLKNGTAWKTTSKLNLSACYANGTNPVAISVRSSKNLANPAAGPFTCVYRMASGCGTGKVGFKLDVKVAANTTYWFVVTPRNSTLLPAGFRLTTVLTL